MYIYKQRSKILGTTCPLGNATSTMEGPILFYQYEIPKLKKYVGFHKVGFAIYNDLMEIYR